MEQPTWIRTGEFSRRAGVSADTALRWARAGRVQAIRLPSGEFRFAETEIARITATAAAS